MIIYSLMFALCVIMAFFSQRYRIVKTDPLGEISQKPNLLFVVLSALPLIFFAGMRGYMADTTAYIHTFKTADFDYIKDVFEHIDENKDVGYKVFTYLIRCLTDNYTVYLFIIAIFSVICIWVTFYKHSPSFTLSVFLYFASATFYWLFNGMRQYIAVAAMFMMFPLLIKKNDIKKDALSCIAFILITLFLSTIHFSALFMIPVFFLCRGKLFGRWQMLAAMAISILSIMVEPLVKLITESFDDTIYNGIVYDMEISSGSHPLRLVVACIPIFLAFLRFSSAKKMNDPKFNFCFNMSIFNFCLMIPATLISGNQFSRIAEYCNSFNFLLYPMIVNRLYYGKERKILITAMVVLYVVWFYFQMTQTYNSGYTSQYLGTFA